MADKQRLYLWKKGLSKRFYMLKIRVRKVERSVRESYFNFSQDTHHSLHSSTNTSVSSSLEEERSFVHLAFEYLPTQYVYHHITSITISELQLLIMVMSNLVILKKVNRTVPLTRTVVLIYTYTWRNDNKKSPFNKNNVATIETIKVVTKILLLSPVEQLQWCRFNVHIQRWFISHY